MKHWICTALFATLALTACGKKETSTLPQHILRLNLSEEPVALDPRVVRSLKDLTVVKQLFEGLMRLDAQGIPQPAIAESVDVSEDLLTYTFHLRDALWSNGEPMKASDFYYAWTSALNPACACDYSYMLYPMLNAKNIREGKCAPELLGVKVIDDKTLVVTLERPVPYFLELTAFPTFFPVHPATTIDHPLWSAPPGDHFVCNGPFQLKTWNQQSDLVFTKNPRYWDNSAVYLDAISFYVIPDNNTESQLFEKDELDWLGQPVSKNITTELMGKMKQEGKLDSYGIAGTLWFKFNTAKEPFDNINIRKAFAYAVSRSDIITHILQGNQALATSPVPPCMALSSQPYFKDANLTEAKTLFEKGLAEKGWDRAHFPTVTFHYVASERNNKIAQTVQQQWREALGVHVELQALERQVYQRNTKQGLFQVGIGDWIADFNDPLAFLEIFKYKIDPETGSGMNDTGWQDAAYIALLEASLREPDTNARKEILRQAETILMEAMPIAPIYHYAFDYVKKPYVGNVVLSPLGIADFKTATLKR